MWLYLLIVLCFTFGVLLVLAFEADAWEHRCQRANKRRKRIERAARRERRAAELVQRKMIIRHGQVLEELEKAHRDLDELEHRHRDLAAQVAELLPEHEERQILSLFHKP